MKDIDQIRRENMASIEADLGGATAAAARAGMSQSQWSNLRAGAADSKTGKPRGMRKDTARKIERAMGRPPGWLDVEHSSESRQTHESEPRPDTTSKHLSRELGQLVSAVTIPKELAASDVRLLTQIALRLRSGGLHEKTRQIIESEGQDQAALENLLTTNQVTKKSKEGA